MTFPGTAPIQVGAVFSIDIADAGSEGEPRVP